MLVISVAQIIYPHAKFLIVTSFCIITWFHIGTVTAWRDKWKFYIVSFRIEVMKRQCEIPHCCLILHCHFKSHWHCHKVKRKFKTLHFFFSSWGDPEVTVWNSLSLLHFSMSLYFASALSQNEVTMFFPYSFSKLKRHEETLNWQHEVSHCCFILLSCLILYCHCHKMKRQWRISHRYSSFALSNTQMWNFSLLLHFASLLYFVLELRKSINTFFQRKINKHFSLFSVCEK